ncbi:MAG: Uma2 family endonuclease [Bacteroidetes bacterium]|nr:Uma2 family endonuclease [Fibrella sp.]
METTIALPRTRIERDELPDEVRVSATWEEYLELAEEVDYNIYYLNGEIISINQIDSTLLMSQATLTHELIVARLSTLFNNYFDTVNERYLVLSSNVKICVAETLADFNADLSVVRGEPIYAVLPSGRFSMVQVKNPEIVVEVLSKSTRRFDQSDKLDQYRMMLSLQHVLFVDQESVFARTYSRTAPNQWLETDYRSLDDVVTLGDLHLNLLDVYRKTPLAP